MQYTCAYFPEPGMTLEAAQRAKMDHVCRKLRLHYAETLRSRWFTREIVTRRWFLHEHVAPLPA